MKIEHLIKPGESENVEFKQGFSRETIVTAAVFATRKLDIFHKITDISDIIRTFL